MTEDLKSPNTRIFLARHGQTEWNKIHRFQGRSDQPLNETGRRQALALANALKDNEFTAVYSSPLSRARETADLVCQYHPDVTIVEEEDIVEMELGEFDGIDGRQWRDQYPDFLRAWAESPGSVRMPGGENLEEVQARAIKVLERIVELHPPGSTLLVCGHNFVLLSILCHAMDISLDRFREVKMDTASYSILQYSDGRFSMEVMNVCPHIENGE